MRGCHAVKAWGRLTDRAARLHVERGDRHAQQVDAVQDDRRRAQALDDQHQDAVPAVGPQVQRLGDAHPQVEHERAQVRQEHRHAAPASSRRARPAHSLRWMAVIAAEPTGANDRVSSGGMQKPRCTAEPGPVDVV